MASLVNIFSIIIIMASSYLHRCLLGQNSDLYTSHEESLNKQKQIGKNVVQYTQKL